MKYITTKAEVRLQSGPGGFQGANSEVTLRHPEKFRLADRRVITLTPEDRERLVAEHHEKGMSRSPYTVAAPGLRFRVVKIWERDADTSGSVIRWELGRGVKILEEDTND